MATVQISHLVVLTEDSKVDELLNALDRLLRKYAGPNWEYRFDIDFDDPGDPDTNENENEAVSLT